MLLPERFDHPERKPMAIKDDRLDLFFNSPRHPSFSGNVIQIIVAGEKKKKEKKWGNNRSKVLLFLNPRFKPQTTIAAARTAVTVTRLGVFIPGKHCATLLSRGNGVILSTAL